MVNNKRSYKRKNKKQLYNRKKIPKEDKAVICYCPKVCPDVMRVRLSYSTNDSFTGGGLATFAGFVYRGNSIFDPEFAIGGGQPMGHDQWASFYRRYRVIASKVTCTAMPDSAGGGQIVVVPLTTSALLSTRESAVEQAYSKKLGVGNDTGLSEMTMTSYIDTDKVRGLPHNGVRYEDDYSASIGANPVKQWFWHVYWDDITSDSNFTTRMNIKIDYYVEFFDRETLLQS